MKRKAVLLIVFNYHNILNNFTIPTPTTPQQDTLFPHGVINAVIRVLILTEPNCCSYCLVEMLLHKLNFSSSENNDLALLLPILSISTVPSRANEIKKLCALGLRAIRKTHLIVAKSLYR